MFVSHVKRGRAGKRIAKHSLFYDKGKQNKKKTLQQKENPSAFTPFPPKKIPSAAQKESYYQPKNEYKPHINITSRLLPFRFPYICVIKESHFVQTHPFRLHTYKHKDGMNGNLLHLYHDNAAEFRSFYIIYKYGHSRINCISYTDINNNLSLYTHPEYYPKH